MSERRNPALEPAGTGDRLDSWKEIAAYLHRDQRTVRRWEQEDALPIHRLGHKKGASVYAFKSELDAWWRRQAGGAPSGGTAATPTESVAAPPARAPDTATTPDRGQRQLLIVVAVLVVALGIGVPLWRHRESAPGGGPADATGGITPTIHSLAVLPLENLSGDRAQDYFAAGLTDELITDLAQMRDLRVVSRTSVMTFQGSRPTMAAIRGALRVDAVVEGSVARVGDRVRLNAQLIYAPTDRHLWAHSFEGDSSDVLRLQDEMARAVATQIQATLHPTAAAEALPPLALPARPPVRAAAYDDYLHGLYWLGTRETDALQRGAAAFTRATREDPNFAPAWAGLAQADCLLNDYDQVSPAVARPGARLAVRRALRLNPALASAHAAQAWIAWRFDWNWPAAEAEFHRALALDANDATTHEWYALFLASQRRPAAAEAEMQAAVTLDPLSSIMQTNLGLIPYYGGDLPKAVHRYQTAEQLDPNFLPVHTKLWLAEAAAGDGATALAELLRINHLLAVSGPPDWDVGLQAGYRTAGIQGLARAMANERQASCEATYCSPYETAMLQSLGGEPAAALRSLDAAVRVRDSWLVYLGVEPTFNTLRADPHFRAIATRVGLSPAS